MLPHCLPANIAGPCPDPLMLDQNGHSRNPKITNNVTGNLARGDLNLINGIVVHQTVSDTATQTLNQYNNANSNWAHFLIAKDGTIHQTASVYQMTRHVGRLRSRCVARGKCTPTDPKRTTSAQEVNFIKGLGPKQRHGLEKKKPFPDRYPMNSDSLGIELVGNTVGPDPNNPNERLFETVTAKQNASLTWLVEQISVQFGIKLDAVFKHPTVSQKTPSEASTANWQVNP